MMPKQILVFRTGQLGDSLVTVPALHQIRKSYPDASIDLLYDQHLGKTYVLPKALLENSGLVDQFIAYPVGYNLAGKLVAFFCILKLLVKLRSSRYTTVVHLEPELKTYKRLQRDKWFFRLAGIQEQFTTLGYRLARKNAYPLKAIEHESDFYLRALGEQDFAKVKKGEGCMNLGLGAKEDKEVSDWLDQLGLQNVPANAMALGVGSKMQSKLWPVERYRTVCQRLIDNNGLQPIFFGGPSDSAIATDLIVQLGCGLNACGKLSLRGSARALQQCCFYLGNDTGTMHLAVAAGLKCVAIFSARDIPGKWYPYGENHIVHRVAVDCEGCMLQECHENGLKCLKAINTDEVYASCVRILNAQANA